MPLGRPICVRVSRVDRYFSTCHEFRVKNYPPLPSINYTSIPAADHLDYLYHLDLSRAVVSCVGTWKSGGTTRGEEAGRQYYYHSYDE